MSGRRADRSTLVEQVFRQAASRPETRSFARVAEVVCRGCSEPLQRVIVEFGADPRAARIPQMLKEHCGIEVSASARKRRHGSRNGTAQRIGDIDRSMIPVVETAEANEQTDELAGLGFIKPSRRHATH